MRINKTHLCFVVALAVAACGPRAGQSGGEGDAGDSAPQPDAGDDGTGSSSAGTSTGSSDCPPPSTVLGDRCYDKVEIAGDVEAHRLIASPGLGDYGPSFVVWGEAKIDGSERSGFFRLEHDKAPRLVLEQLMTGYAPRASDLAAARLALEDQGRVNYIVASAASSCGGFFLPLFHAKYLAAHGDAGPILPSIFLPECDGLGFSRRHLVPLDIDGSGLDEFVALSASSGVGDVYFNDNEFEDPVTTTALRRSGVLEFETSCSTNIAVTQWKPLADSNESVLVLGRDCESSPLSLHSFRPDTDGVLFEQRTLALYTLTEAPDTAALEVADIDLDGADDVIIATNGLLLRVGVSGVDFTEVEILEATPTAHAPFSSDEKLVGIGTGDFFGSSDAEVVVREASGLALVSTGGEPSVRLDIDAQHFAVLDVNEDGSADLAASTTDGLVLWISN